MDVMYNYSKTKIKSSLEIDKIMKKLENTYQDASLIKKALLGDASDKEQQVLEQRLSMHPELKAVYEKLQDSEELKDAFVRYTGIKDTTVDYPDADTLMNWILDNDIEKMTEMIDKIVIPVKKKKSCMDMRAYTVPDI